MARLSTRILKKFTSCTRRQTISENDSDAEPKERYPEQNDSGRYTTSTGMKTELEVQNKKNVNLRKEKHDLNQQLARLTHINKQLQNENSVYRRTMLEGSKITEEGGGFETLHFTLEFQKPLKILVHKTLAGN